MVIKVTAVTEVVIMTSFSKKQLDTLTTDQLSGQLFATLAMFFAEKGDFSNKKRPKRDPKSGLGLLRDPGLPKRDPIGSSACPFFGRYVKGTQCFIHINRQQQFKNKQILPAFVQEAV